MRIVAISFLALVLCGCGKAEPTLAGGKPVSYWVQALKDPDAKVRKRAVFKLGNVGPADAAALPALVGALHDGDARVRAEAILALMKCGPGARESVPALSDMQQRDRDAHVRAHAGKALERLKAGG